VTKAAASAKPAPIASAVKLMPKGAGQLPMVMDSGPSASTRCIRTTSQASTASSTTQQTTLCTRSRPRSMSSTAPPMRQASTGRITTQSAKGVA